MKVNLFNLNKNKKFNYKTRYLKDKSYNNIYEFDSIYQKQNRNRSSYDVSSKWGEDRLMYRNSTNSNISKTLIFIVLFLVFVFLYIIDFDLSIFYQ
ncbi:hypothetical protein N9326_01100 [Flavobacteriaceae bacterium]|nr:hypothetical protein [Flavobacteriaceae bacterium]MDB3901089.1 hypothetical protein [Flavobacteriaceae bacterium]MDC0117414.1 hypothetical protein [Flavobacteriaceae bacterium]